MRIRPVYAWTISKEPADPLVTKQELAARKGIVIKGKTGKRYRVEKSPIVSTSSIMASVQSCVNNGSSKRSKEEATTLLSLALNKI